MRARISPQLTDLQAQIVSSVMQDMTMLFLTALFFGVAFLYVKALQKLR
jgi:hypothetical protein